MLVALSAVILIVLVVWLLPELWVRLCQRRPLHVGGPAQVALTFDDGPEPQTTPLVLDALAELGLKATFFVLGERAAAHPELLRRMAEEGHEVALHGHQHRHHWLRPTPWVGADMARARAAVTEALGSPPHLFRPPWGMVTAGTLWAVRRSGLRLALYDVESGDWLRDGPAAIERRVLGRVRPGSVVLLHDAARDSAQVADMLAALRLVVPQLRERGYDFARLSDLLRAIPRRSALVTAWIAWERLFARLTGALGMTDSIHVLPYTYRGPARLLDGREVLKTGDRCLDIHFHNELLYQLPGEAAERLGGLTRHALPDMGRIARLLVEDPRLANVRGLTAITLFHRPAVRLGFHAEPLEPPWRRRFFTWYMRLIKRVYQGPAAAGSGREVRFVWITREEFIARMSPGGDQGRQSL